MNKRVATIAQIQRTVKALEAMGKPVSGVRVCANGDAEVLIGEPSSGTVLAPKEDLWGEFDKVHGHG